MDLSFSGAGFMGCYYFGVANCWNKYIPRERVNRAAGASAGSLIAAYYLMDLPLGSSIGLIIEMLEEMRRRPLGVFDRSNQMVDVLPRVLDRMFPEDAHKRVSGRLFVSMTRLKDLKCVIVNEFETRKDLIDALNCSCFIPVWSGNHVSTFKGTKYIDGGFTNNLPVFDEHTVRVCCFSGASDIAPYDRSQRDFLSGSAMGMPFYLTWKNMRRAGNALWPPPPSYIMELLKRGYQDAKSFILSNDLIQCDACFKAAQLELQPIYSKLTPTISPAASPSVSRAGAATAANPNAAATLKQLEGMLEVKGGGGGATSNFLSDFEAQRSKSGRQISLAALERARLADGGGKSFARKLREKLTRATSVKAPGDAASKAAAAAAGAGRARAMSSPQVASNLAARPARGSGRKPAPPTIGEIMRRQEREAEAAARAAGSSRGSTSDGDDDENDDERRSSASSSASASSLGDESGDSAVGGLRSRASTRTTSVQLASQSPSDKFLASRKMSLAAAAAAAAEQQQLMESAAAAAAASGGSTNSLQPDRFAFLPSQLPSCPPSPNLNRHCGECIRLRQRARMDALDQSIVSEAERYGALESRDPAKEFGGLRYKLASWLQGQFGAPKYSYELCGFDEADAPAWPAAFAPLQAAARQRQRRPSEIPTN